jgi:hypothetical protein
MPPAVDQVRGGTWTAAVNPQQWEKLSPAYAATLVEQYKLYVEMADRISARRALTNTFFLALNTAVFTVIGVFWKDRPEGSAWFLFFPLIAVVGQCLAWYFLIRSYRQLNGAKYAVIGVMEERLPASPYWRAEWLALGEGKDPAKYWSFTHLEQWVPLLFALTYVGAFAVAVIA